MTTLLIWSAGTLELDACIKEDHDLKVEVTKFPVESGLAVTDHARPEPDEITIEGLISNTPLGTKTTLPSGAASWVEAAWAMLWNLYEHPELVTVVSPLRLREEMLLTALKSSREAREGDSLPFTATFRHVRLVTNKQTLVAVKTKTGKAKPKQVTGSAALTTTSAPPPGTAYNNAVTLITGSSGSPYQLPN